MTASTQNFEHLQLWETEGIVVMEDAISGDALARLQEWVSEISQQPGTAEGLLQYDESTPDGQTIRCRTENFVPFHEGLRDLVTTGLIPQIASDLLGEEALLYKEKINYKAAGGAGFAPHQDAPAYPNVRQTVACMIAVDDATIENGCLQVARSRHQEELPTDDGGCIDPAVAETLRWEHVPVKAGTLMWFHCYVPHRSGPNVSTGTRRAIYLTYNAASDGNLREAYYAEKIPALAANPDRLSLISHFTGSASPVTGEVAR